MQRAGRSLYGTIVLACVCLFYSHYSDLCPFYFYFLVNEAHNNVVSFVDQVNVIISYHFLPLYLKANITQVEKSCLASGRHGSSIFIP